MLWAHFVWHVCACAKWSRWNKLIHQFWLCHLWGNFWHVARDVRKTWGGQGTLTWMYYIGLGRKYAHARLFDFSRRTLHSLCQNVPNFLEKFKYIILKLFRKYRLISRSFCTFRAFMVKGRVSKIKFECAAWIFVYKSLLCTQIKQKKIVFRTHCVDGQKFVWVTTAQILAVSIKITMPQENIDFSAIQARIELIFGMRVLYCVYYRYLEKDFCEHQRTSKNRTGCFWVVLRLPKMNKI